MFEKFTKRAQKVLQLANQEAQRLNHECSGAEHVLLGLVREGTSFAAKVLQSSGVYLRKTRPEVEAIVQSGPSVRLQRRLIPNTTRAKKVIEYAVEEARLRHDNGLGSDHLLLGLFSLRVGDWENGMI